jgi:hypothetical protein
MGKKLTTLVLCLVFLATATAAFAADVYVTKRGKKYHTEFCRLIQSKDVQKISEEDAKTKGLAPCRKCFNDDLSSDAIKAGKPERLTKKQANKSLEQTQGK